MPRCGKAHPSFRRSGIGRRRGKGTGPAYSPLREMSKRNAVKSVGIHLKMHTYLIIVRVLFHID